MTPPTPHALEVARYACFTKMCVFGGYGAMKRRANGDYVKFADVAALIDREREAARREAVEECALLHEQVNIDDHREPMAVVIEYRDKIRSLRAPANGESK